MNTSGKNNYHGFNFRNNAIKSTEQTNGTAQKYKKDDDLVHCLLHRGSIFYVFIYFSKGIALNSSMFYA